MNKIHIKKCKISYGYDEYYWFIDDKSLPQYLAEWATTSNDKNFKEMAPYDVLCSAWNKDIEWAGDVKFVWKTIDMSSTVLPLLLCPEDVDFSCIVIVAEVKKNEEYVYWNKIGYVMHEKENFEEEKRSGILYTKAYSDEDWKKYGDNIAKENVDSPQWKKWIGENWTEELFRRRMNYTLPFYETKGNICWIKETNWIFKREEYDNMVDLYRKIQKI